MQKKKMNLLIIHNNFGMGGIETQLLQYLPIMVEDGVSVDVVLVSGASSSELFNELLNYAHVMTLRIWERIPLFQTIQLGDKYDVIFCTGWRAYVHGLRLKQRLHLNARLCLGIYHPREFSFGNEQDGYQRLLFNSLKSIPESNIFFHHNDYKKELSEVLQRPFNSAALVPFAINIKERPFLERAPVRYRIITIGRLVDFKQYHFAMIDVVAALRNEGYPFEYHIYGYGPLEEALTFYIKEKSVEDAVKLHGVIAYHELASVFKEAFVFIGMGVAVVDACVAGVPSLVAIESNRVPETYGFYCEQNDFNTGSIDLRKKRYSIAGKLKSILDLDEDGYSELCISSRKSIEVSDAEVLAKKFCVALNNTKKFNFPPLGLRFFVLDGLVSMLWVVLDKIKIHTPITNRYLKK